MKSDAPSGYKRPHEDEASGRDVRVIRRSDLLPPVGMSKRIVRDAGVTQLFGIPVAPFSVVRSRGPQLRYRCLPIVDVLSPRSDGGWDGRGLLMGLEFCRFRLIRSGR